LSVAVYPGTFDPVHYGHIDIARRAAKVFDKVVVGIYDRPQKNLMFSLDERLGMLRDVLGDVSNIQVRGYSGLTVDFARQQGAHVIVRGLRVISDFELEYQMALTNRKLAPDVDVLCLMTSLEYAFISSSIVKEIALAGGSVAQLVPANVAEALLERLASRRQG
jgi:pantetheine-phosphate adenylyltransferase